MIRLTRQSQSSRQRPLCPSISMMLSGKYIWGDVLAGILQRLEDVEEGLVDRLDALVVLVRRKSLEIPSDELSWFHGTDNLSMMSACQYLQICCSMQLCTHPSIHDESLFARLQLELSCDEAARSQVLVVLFSCEDLRPEDGIERECFLCVILARHVDITEAKRAQQLLWGEVREDVRGDELRE